MCIALRLMNSRWRRASLILRSFLDPHRSKAQTALSRNRPLSRDKRQPRPSILQTLPDLSFCMPATPVRRTLPHPSLFFMCGELSCMSSFKLGCPAYLVAPWLSYSHSTTCIPRSQAPNARGSAGRSSTNTFAEPECASRKPPPSAGLKSSSTNKANNDASI